MANYSYLESMKEDIKDYITENYEKEDYENISEEQLNDDLWTEDSVTGNASGSYTFCRATAKEYVQDNMDLVQEMADEFGIDKATIGEKFLDDEWEWFDVSIRCYLLGAAIHESLEELLEDTDC